MKTHAVSDTGSYIGRQSIGGMVNVTKSCTTASRNKIVRIPGEKIGNRFLIIPIQNRENEYRLVNSDEEGSVPVRANSYPFFTYISILHEIPYEGYMTLFHLGATDYYLRPSTEFEINSFSIHKNGLKRQAGDLFVTSQGQRVCISRDTRDYLCSTGFLKIRVVQQETELYIEAWPVIQDEFEHLPNLLGAQSYGIDDPNMNARFLKEYTYGRKMTESDRHVNSFPLPMSFFRKLRFHENKKMHVWKRDDGAVVMEAYPLKCSICGSPINRYMGNGRLVYTCSKCRSDLRALQRHIMKRIDSESATETESIVNYKELSNELKAFKNDLESIIRRK